MSKSAVVLNMAQANVIKKQSQRRWIRSVLRSLSHFFSSLIHTELLNNNNNNNNAQITPDGVYLFQYGSTYLDVKSRPFRRTLRYRNTFFLSVKLVS